MKTLKEYQTATDFKCTPQDHLKLNDTRMIVSEPGAFCRDFARPGDGDENDKPLHSLARAEILKFGSLISKPHASPNDVHGALHTSGGLIRGYRPPRYGRAAIFVLGEDEGSAAAFDGILDVKGVGVGPDHVPARGGANTGMLVIHEALCEWINAAVLKRLFERDGVALATMPFYGLTLTGVKTYLSWAETPLPCATLVRKAMVRPVDNNELPKGETVEEEIHHAVERYLLSRGLTTTGPISTVTILREAGDLVTRLDGNVVPAVSEDIAMQLLQTMNLEPPQIFHFSNVQIARGATLYPLRACLSDLGHIRMTTGLCGHMGTFVDDKPLNWGKVTLAHSPHHPVVDPDLAVSDSLLGYKYVGAGGCELPTQLRDWLKPTANMRAGMAGVMLEALKIAQGVQVENWSESDVATIVQSIAEQSVRS